MQITSTTQIGNQHLVVASDRKQLDWAKNILDSTQQATLQAIAESTTGFVAFSTPARWVFVQFVASSTEAGRLRENMRRAGAEAFDRAATYQITEVLLLNYVPDASVLDLAEGAALSSYQFLKYFKNADQRKVTLHHIQVLQADTTPLQLQQLNIVVEATFKARTLVNEPLSYLTAVKFSQEMELAGEEAGFSVQVLDKKQIEALQMGGLLSVNKGSFDPPTFTVMEWKPDNCTNSKPLVLVGKGVVYDTGGLSLKPTPNSMDYMKCDMAGAAIVVATLYAIAKAKLPIHVVGLVPATDNRPGHIAYVPGDVITISDGTTVEVLNTDAEGRLILADALHYAKRYNPELVLDFATLTGAAAAAIGQQGIVYMATADTQITQQLETSGTNVHERLVRFPLWDEYGEQIKSDIADIKNLGGPTAGAITAGKFLQHFTDYPWVHLDIAGGAFLHTKDSYRGKGGTGIGVRMVFDFLKNYAAKA
jgi:leucyl aminopeptidase